MHRLSKVSLATAALLLMLATAVPITQGQASAESGSTSGDSSGSSSGGSVTSGSGDSTDGSSQSTDSNTSGNTSGGTTENGTGGTSSQPSGSSTNEQLRKQAMEKAREARRRAMEKAKEAQQKVAEAEDKAKRRDEEAKKNAGAKLGAGQLRACQNHQRVIKNIMGRIGKHGSNNLQLIDTVSERVQQFYTDNKLTVDNYDALLAAVTSARSAAETASSSTDGVQTSFDCTSNDPQGTATSFKELMTARNTAIKNYRDAVKQLVEAVKAAAKAQGVNPTSNTSMGNNGAKTNTNNGASTSGGSTSTSSQENQQ